MANGNTSIKKSKENKIDLSIRIGNRLKELRKSMGLSMKRLADETGLSPPLFSRIENGLVMPSIPTLQTISDILKVDIGYFFEKGEEKGFVISRSGSRRVIKSKRGSKGKMAYQVELLAEGMENIFMEPVIVTLLGKDDDVEAIGHVGQEFSYVLEGKMELTLGKKKFILKKDDCAYYNAFIPHKGISLSSKPAKTLNVHLIPGRRTGIFEIKR
jgi:transcriptional regulator with XRE-family HTH domain